jgi:hypothetical protein
LGGSLGLSGLSVHLTVEPRRNLNCLGYSTSTLSGLFHLEPRRSLELSDLSSGCLGYQSSSPSSLEETSNCPTYPRAVLAIPPPHRASKKPRTVRLILELSGLFHLEPRRNFERSDSDSSASIRSMRSNSLESRRASLRGSDPGNLRRPPPRPVEPSPRATAGRRPGRRHSPGRPGGPRRGRRPPGHTWSSHPLGAPGGPARGLRRPVPRASSGPRAPIRGPDVAPRLGLLFPAGDRAVEGRAQPIRPGGGEPVGGGERRGRAGDLAEAPARHGVPGRRRRDDEPRPGTGPEPQPRVATAPRKAALG